MAPTRALPAIVAAFLAATASAQQPCPQITTQPTSQPVCPAGTPTLSTAATGGEPLSFQWQVRHPNNAWDDITEGADVLAQSDIPEPLEFWAHSQGSTTSQLHIFGISSNAGRGFLTGLVDFRCIITGSCGTTTTATAYLRICRVDTTCDGQFTPADVATFVFTWFTSLQQGTLEGDYDANGQIVPADVGSYVGAWFNSVVTGTCW